MAKYYILILSCVLYFADTGYTRNSQIFVGGDHNYRPYEFLDNGKPSGFNVELLKEAAKLAGYEAVFELKPWDQTVNNLETGRLDAITGMYYSKERNEKFDFSLPYILVSSGFFLRKDSSIKNFKDIDGLVIGVQEKDFMHDYALKNFKKSVIKTGNDPIDAIRLLQKNKVDVVLLSSKIQGAYYIFKNKIKDIKYLNTDIPSLQYCFAVKKGNLNLIEKLNESLFILKTNGTYNRLYEKWFGKYERREVYRDILGYVTAGILIFFFIIGAGLFWTYSLKRKVREQTKELSFEIRRRKKAEENFEILLESIGDGVITIDGEKKIVWLNSSAESMLGLKKDEVKGRPYFECLKMKNTSGEEIDLRVDLILEKGQKRSLEQPFIVESESGQEFVVSGSGSPIKDKNGEIKGGVFVIRDITKEYELEKQLQHSQKMDALGRLAGGVAHDFNNMLSAILGVAEILEMKLDPDDENLSMTEILKQACARASDLTSKLLAFSRKSPIEMKLESLHSVIENAYSILKHGINPDIEIILNLNAKNCFAMLNSARMENVIINLVLNARDAMPNGGTITIETQNVIIDEAYCSASPFDIKPGEFIFVSITDTGVGMSMDIQKKIFEPFFTTKEKGTGLGLPSVYGVIQQHQGSVNVYSEENSGTSFHIYIPVEKKSFEPQIHKQKEYSKTRQPALVLVIDDEEMIRTLAGNILEKNGYTVITAENGKNGVEKYRENMDKIDAVILDMIMPEMDGKKCLEEIISINPDAKIIIASGFYKNSTRASLLEKGARCFIKKPYSSKDLLEKLEEIIG